MYTHLILENIPDHKELLQRAYIDILKPSMPESMLEDLEDIEHLLRHPEDGDVIITTSSVSPSTPTGILTLNHYTPAVSLLGYLAIDTYNRNEGVGTQLLEHALNYMNNRAPSTSVLAEIEDPNHYPEHPTQGNPAKRVNFYRKFHARRAPINYFQPPLHATSPSAQHMHLIAIRPQRFATYISHPNNVDLSDFITAYFAETREYFTTEDYANMREMLRRISEQQKTLEWTPL